MIKKIKEFFLLRYDPIGYAVAKGVNVGVDCRLINTSASTYGSEPYLVTIGSHVTITSGVKFITHDGGVWVFRGDEPDIEIVAPIKIGNNVFIGANTIILAGVVVGDNCIIGAGSILTKNVPSNSVAAGVPARVIKSIKEYESSIKETAFYTRNLTPDDKKKYFLNNAKYKD